MNARIGCLVAVWAAVAGVWGVGGFAAFERRLIDWYAAGHAPRTADPQIAVVAIDAQSLKAEGAPWPWPRATHAGLIRTLSEQGVKGIVFDVVFDRPSPDDAALAEAIKAAGVVVLAAERVAEATPVGLMETTSPPAPVLAEAATGVGVARLALSGDGAVR
ncbi:MAG: CHASE2 domain-containing protein, partial [Pseudomonadota bacterium]